MEGCIFCKIVNGEIPAAKVYEDKGTLAFLDIAPASPKGGHTLVMPKRHYELITDVPEVELVAVSKTMKRMSEVLLKFGEGLNIVQNNKKVAGQFVPHVHFHLIPRFTGDGITVEKWSAHKYPQGEMEQVAGRIKSLLKE